MYQLIWDWITNENKQQAVCTYSVHTQHVSYNGMTHDIWSEELV